LAFHLQLSGICNNLHVQGERIQLLIFENSPGLILNAQRYLSKRDTWFATMDDDNTRVLVLQRLAAKSM